MIGPACVAMLATLIVGCATPAPSPVVPATAATPAVTVATPAASIAPAPTVASTPAPTATPVPSLEAHGVEVFTPLEKGHWVIVSSSDNLDEIAHTSVLSPVGDTIEIHTICVGTGLLHVNATAVAPGTPAPGAVASETPVFETDVRCPAPNGEAVVASSSVSEGWFVNVDAVPSDPSIKYQVLVGTVVD
jgi:hypothetical protein